MIFYKSEYAEYVHGVHMPNLSLLLPAMLTAVAAATDYLLFVLTADSRQIPRLRQETF